MEGKEKHKGILNEGFIRVNSRFAFINTHLLRVRLFGGPSFLRTPAVLLKLFNNSSS